MAKTLGQVAEGQLVKLNESGKPVEFYVAKQSYESGLNGSGRTLVVRKDCYDNRRWHSSNVNAYASSAIDSWLNGTYKNLLDANIRGVIGTTKIKYTPGNGNNTVGTLQRAIFLLSATELNRSASWFNVEGTELEIASSLQIAYMNGPAVVQWTRSPRTADTINAVYLRTNGDVDFGSCAGTRGCRPAFTLPGTLYVWDDGTVSNLGPAPSSITTPAIIMQGGSVPISWDGVSGADSYILQRKADSGEWEQVYAGNDLTFTDTAGAWSNVQYQVCGVFDGTNGAFAQSDVITVVPTSTLVISGTDGDLGTITSDILYSVVTDTGNQISLTRTVNGVLVASLTVDSGFSYSIPVMDLPTGTGTIVITATVQASGGPVTVKRTWTYTKQAQTFPGSGGLAQLAQDGQNMFPLTLAEAVKTIGGPWGGNLSTALDKLAKAATYTSIPKPKYTQVTVDLSAAQAGNVVNLPVNGVMVPHIVVQVGNPDPEMYDSSCDGVWLFRQSYTDLKVWNATNANTLDGSTIMTTLQGYVENYDSSVQGAIRTVKIPYCIGGGNSSVNKLSNGLECKIFPLGMYEVGFTSSNHTGIPQDGAKLSYFDLGSSSGANKKREILSPEGVPSSYFTRTPQTNQSNSVWFITSDGQFTNSQANQNAGYPTCFIIPSTFQATYYVDTDGNVYPEQEYTTGKDFYDLWGNIIPTVKIETGSYVGTGTYGSGNPNKLTFSGKPLLIFVYIAAYFPMLTATDSSHVNFIAGFQWAKGITQARAGVGLDSGALYFEEGEKTLSWYHTKSEDSQANNSGTSYFYLAFIL